MHWVIASPGRRDQGPEGQLAVLPTVSPAHFLPVRAVDTGLHSYKQYSTFLTVYYQCLSGVVLKLKLGSVGDEVCMIVYWVITYLHVGNERVRLFRTRKPPLYNGPFLKCMTHLLVGRYHLSRWRLYHPKCCQMALGTGPHASTTPGGDCTSTTGSNLQALMSPTVGHDPLGLR